MGVVQEWPRLCEKVPHDKEVGQVGHPDPQWFLGLEQRRHGDGKRIDPLERDDHLGRNGDVIIEEPYRIGPFRRSKASATSDDVGRQPSLSDPKTARGRLGQHARVELCFHGGQGR